MSNTHKNNAKLEPYLGKKVTISSSSEGANNPWPTKGLYLVLEGILLRNDPWYWYIRADNCKFMFCPEKVWEVYSIRNITGSSDCPCAFIHIRLGGIFS